MKKKAKYLIIIVGCILLGILADRNKEYLINAQFIRTYLHFRKEIPNKEEIVKSDKVMIFLAFGQSNAGNYGNGSYVSKNEVYNYYKGKLYHAKEPLLGPDGGGSSVWTRVGDMLIDSGLYKKVIIVPCAIGGTSVKCWSEGECKEKLLSTLDYLQRDNIKLTDIFWDQGETDNVDNTTTAEYKARLRTVIKMLRDRKFNAPFFVSISSYFPYNNNNLNGIDKDITNAQNELITEGPNIKRGPNTDSLNLAYYRADAVHFTEKGLDQLALKWFQSIKKSKN